VNNRGQWAVGSGRYKAELKMALLLLICLGPHAVQGAERDGRWAILIAGASGDPDLKKAYLKELTDFRSILQGPLGFPRDQVVALFEDPSKGPGIIQRGSTREDLQAVCRDLAGRARQEDTVFVFIEGHGDYDGRTYKLQLVGPDLTAEELAPLLYSIPARFFVVVNATSGSGGSLPAFSQKGKIVITATKSGMEKNITHLGQYFIDAFRNNAADSDKDGRVSMMEAFFYSSRMVEEYYKDERSLQTEHPVLDDNGDGQAQSKPGPDNGEGLLARMVFLENETAANMRANLTREQQQGVREARDLVMQIEALKFAKSKMTEAEYEKQLEVLLLRLAQINEKLPK
jgi:hypothetical protein